MVKFFRIFRQGALGGEAATSAERAARGLWEPNRRPAHPGRQRDRGQTDHPTSRRSPRPAAGASPVLMIDAQDISPAPQRAMIQPPPTSNPSPTSPTASSVEPPAPPPQTPRQSVA